LAALRGGKVSTNVYLRRIHNLTLATDWLLKPIIPQREIQTKTQEGYTEEEAVRLSRRIGWHLSIYRPQLSAAGQYRRS